jgi:membrane-bound lytic murein transglycosylase B
MKIFPYRIIIVTLLSFFALPAVFAIEPWNIWVKQVRAEAIAQGIRPQLFDEVFAGMTPSSAHIQLDRKQPEKRLTYMGYRNSRADNHRIKLGRQEYKKYSILLNEIGNDYGVDPCFITAIWGLETSYGRFMGKYPVIRSLATLAYDARRAEFFRRELFYALHILNEGHIDNKDFKGEWAGASGHPQFLPSSWHRYAVDHNGDNHRDIWNTHADVFASIANYLSQNGWQANQPLSAEVTLPPDFDLSQAALTIEKPASEWLSTGVEPMDKITDQSIASSIIAPDGGPNFMVFNNFKVLMTWNHSIYYAGTVGYMADKICQRS